MLDQIESAEPKFAQPEIRDYNRIGKVGQKSLCFFQFLSAIHLVPASCEIVAISIHQLFIIVDYKNSVCHAGIQARRKPNGQDSKALITGNVRNGRSSAVQQ